MTNWIVGHSNRYKVAVSENGICNLISKFNSDYSWYSSEREMERTVWDNLEWYMRASPIFYVEQMQTPMLLLQAEDDYRCPIDQGEQLFTALVSRGVPVEMVRFPGESHTQLSSGKPETRLVRRMVTLEWFQRYL
jgi:dipeptidyl aminopeptidase/acylaminoacyl peptidase